MGLFCLFGWSGLLGLVDVLFGDLVDVLLAETILDSLFKSTVFTSIELASVDFVSDFASVGCCSLVVLVSVEFTIASVVCSLVREETCASVDAAGVSTVSVMI